MKLTNALPMVCTVLLAAAALTARAERCFYLPMDVTYGQVTNTVNGRRFAVEGTGVVETLPGVKGPALRLDGYSNYIAATAEVGDLTTFTFSAWTAMETWPIIEHDVQNETEMTCIAGIYDAEAKRGFGFFISRTGKYSFKFYSGGWPGEIVAPQPLPLYQWNNLVAVGDGSRVTFYNNGQELGSTTCRTVNFDGTFMVAKARDVRMMGPFNLNTINGLIDEVEVYNDAIPYSTFSAWTAENNPPLLTIANPDKFAGNILLPLFHGKPVRNWTNETHGLLYHNGLYHVFFQKNANGPFMSRLQWGHLVSENLYDWEELPIAIGTDQWFDLKGCWSGCIVVDDKLTGGKPNIIYTGVDYARAMICQATPLDDELIEWSKRPSPIINGRPIGLSDDFRDPYFFRNGDDAYIIVGTSKDGRGACTLHKYDPISGNWSNDGKIFFQATAASTHGTFWEMPNVTKIGDKWLFTVTPLGTSDGVKLIYWVGTIAADGTFVPQTNGKTVEFSGFAKDGYGLLSSSVTQHDGRTIALGIVPDKLSQDQNYRNGWAHSYSLPREWSLDADNNLVQRPVAELEGLRGGVAFSQTAVLDGTTSMGEMDDRMAEVCGRFTIGTADFGFTFFESADGKCARLTFSPSTQQLTLDFSSLPRISNDGHLFAGVYRTSLPQLLTAGSEMKIHVFVDRSTIDIFVNDRWASSVRLFPTESSGTGMSVFSTGGPTNATVEAWTLQPSNSGIDNVWNDTVDEPVGNSDIFNFSGVRVRSNAPAENPFEGLPAGFYIYNGRKHLIQ